MSRAIIISSDQDFSKRINTELTREGISCSIYPDINHLVDNAIAQKVDAVIIDSRTAASAYTLDNVKLQLAHIKRFKNLSVIMLIPAKMLNIIVTFKELDDFVLEPYNLTEITARTRRLLNQRSQNEFREVLEYNDLVINMINCEVLLNGKLVALTFKEYELLKLLATNKGRVFSREALLNEIWGFDYYGGDRTVDVHIRRLRSKIEDGTHSFVDTVRNIGYKFKDEIKSNEPL